MSKIYRLSILGLILITSLVLARPINETQSAPPLDVSDTLSTSQLSYFARLGTGNTAGGTTVRIGSTGTPNTTTANLFVGDTVAIYNTGTTGVNHYVITGIGDTATFQINVGLSAPNAAELNYVVATRSAIHTLAFTPQTNDPGGSWEFLIKATSRANETNNDGIPDQQGFDLGRDVGSTTTGIGTRLKTADVTCPFGVAEVGATAVVDSNTYHVIACNLAAGATNPVGVGVTVTIGRALTSGSQLINPSASVGRAVSQLGNADVYTFFMRHRDGSDLLINEDTLQGKIAVVESVRVTATIDPTLTFTIDNTGVGSGANICGNSLGSPAANTTATSVAFGTVSVGQFNDLAQRLSCVTNATGGYIVTVYQSGLFTNTSTGTGTTIPNTNCDSGSACSTTTATPWIADVGGTNSEWGYSIQNIGASAVAFSYGGGGNFNARSFGTGASQAQWIMRSGVTPAALERAYICYRLTASTFQEAGKYETKLVYTATATF